MNLTGRIVLSEMGCGSPPALQNVSEDDNDGATGGWSCDAEEDEEWLKAASGVSEGSQKAGSLDLRASACEERAGASASDERAERRESRAKSQLKQGVERRRSVFRRFCFW